ncbi:MAG TPA: uroporphyrinogen-III C-methyltransferase [Vicinamibacterales bacterium]|jgi:uroporphyrin-III C-methyltransferase/precorrin-2 dehydrogenase/sirohydrochlorin ferrochelatase|nr:uroporphyrinogen-III C-methyltransferase [Vicinamibacterales bacterium]
MKNVDSKPAPEAVKAVGRVSLVGAGPGDPELWTVRAARLVREADLVLYDALVDAVSLRGLTGAPCFHVGKRAGRTSVKQETIHKLMIRAARHGKHVVRLKGGDPFVFGRGAEEAIALAEAGIPFEIVPGVTTAVAAAELAGIPVTHRGVAAGFVVLAGHTSEALDGALGAIAPNSLTVVVMMAVAGRAAVAERLMAHGWAGDTPAAIVCGASTPESWSWTGRLNEFERVETPDGVAGVLIVGDVVTVRAAMSGHGADGTDRRGAEPREASYGRN